jgi:hypothetical protein
MLAVVAGVYKIRQTPEWAVMTGNVEQRVVACRSVYMKSIPRARWMLRRLLADPVAQVRYAAIEALSRMPELGAAFRDDLVRLAEDEDPSVKGRALSDLLAGGTVTDPLLVAAVTAIEDQAFRRDQLLLLSRVIDRRAERKDPKLVEWILSILPDADPGELAAMQAIHKYAELLQPHRDALIEPLNGDISALSVFVVNALSAIDGVMRGYATSDWIIDAPAPAPLPPKAIDRMTIEAETAYSLRPNYQVETHDGERCLYLGEGAGGRSAWSLGDSSSVDIGAGSLPFAIETTGEYQVWVRGWFENKCGNSTGLQLDGERIGFANQHAHDARDRYRIWHWKQAHARQRLKAGRHLLTVTAIEDGASLDKYAVLPAGEIFDPTNLPPPNALFDASVPSSISITTEMQTQLPGSTQSAVAWVRRNRPDLRNGRLRGSIDQPFELLGPDEIPLAFEENAALGHAPIRIRVPESVHGIEAALKIVFKAGNKIEAVGQTLISVPFDWLTTGPLAMSDERCKTLMARTRLTAGDLAEGWSPYPARGFDRYRRFDFEKAYGNSINKEIFLYTEVAVEQAGQYLSLLTLDDAGFVWIDGRQIAGRAEHAFGEGRLMTDKIRLAKGRHQVLIRVSQGGHVPPEGPDSPYGTPNHWVCKWLLRAQRHTPAAGVSGVSRAEFRYGG